jgi:hypothetical protein
VEVVMRRFCIDLEAKPLLYARMPGNGKKIAVSDM